MKRQQTLGVAIKTTLLRLKLLKTQLTALFKMVLSVKLRGSRFGLSLRNISDVKANWFAQMGFHPAYKTV
ncbi:hypothetical protein WAE56_14090 [Iodobacter sp. LRB]|uniref:hypothetical protein n=1 Tax=unclassified Iodobacter TaxID=235634 RepID=UPI000C105E90|nr:hypothetical protein [Iodobacter sp. BJB302]PHV01594.1 hypothetical protein CSQ88_11175 [Iodobacter sp. BJB302]